MCFYFALRIQTMSEKRKMQTLLSIAFCEQNNLVSREFIVTQLYSKDKVCSLLSLPTIFPGPSSVRCVYSINEHMVQSLNTNNKYTVLAIIILYRHPD